MNTHVDCISCIVNKANNLANKYIPDKRSWKLLFQQFTAKLKEYIWKKGD